MWRREGKHAWGVERSHESPAGLANQAGSMCVQLQVLFLARHLSLLAEAKCPY
jgi:hypothetical protein